VATGAPVTPLAPKTPVTLPLPLPPDFLSRRALFLSEKERRRELSGTAAAPPLPGQPGDPSLRLSQNRAAISPRIGPAR